MKKPIDVLYERHACSGGIAWVESHPDWTPEQIFDESTHEGDEVCNALCFFHTSYGTKDLGGCPGHFKARTPKVLEQIAKLRAAFVAECNS